MPSFKCRFFIFGIFLLVYSSLLSSFADARQPKSNSSVSSTTTGIAISCLFPESTERQFFFDITSDTPPRSIVLDTVVEPSDAKLTIANIRSNNLPQEFDVNDWFSMEKRANGQFLVFTSGQPLTLPPYPSSNNETLLYVTVRCNQRMYPLMTIRIRATNEYTPEWIGSSRPYEMTIPKNTPPGAIFDTPLLALDQDPVDHYTITYSIEPPYDRDFALMFVERNSLSVTEQARFLSILPQHYSHHVEDWRMQQLPPIVKLKVLGKVALNKPSYFLNVTASDNGFPVPQRIWTQLKLSLRSPYELVAARFTRSEYFGNFTKQLQAGDELIPAEPLFALFTNQRAGDRIQYELDQGNPYSQLFRMEPETGRIRLAQSIPDGIPQNVELDIQAHLISKDPTANGVSAPIARTKLTLTDQTEIRLTYFTQCHYETHLAENPSAYTRVLQFNFKGDVDGVELLNGSDLFKVDQYGLMSVRPGANIDREQTSRIVLKARLKSKSALHPKSLELCQIATADILIDDINDHKPRFTRRSYHFRIESNPYNNTEVGTLHAIDGDSGEFGQVRYRLLDDFVSDGHGGEEPLPFVLFQADGAATLFFVIKPLHLELQQPYKPQSEYTFTVEAYDSIDDPRTARVSVNVRLEDEPKGGAGNSDRFEMEQQQEIDQLEGPEARDQPSDEGDGGGLDADIIGQARRSLPDGLPAKAMSAQTKPIDKDASQRETTKTLATAAANSAQNQQRIRFAQEHYTFRLGGILHEGQTIGWVQVKQRATMSDGEKDEPKEEQIEYAVEEGISGFVDVDSTTGRLFVGPHLAGDKFEEIRFSIAAQDRNGRVWATALVSVLIDESSYLNVSHPIFEQQHYHFRLDLSERRPWPRPIGQVQATMTTANGSLATTIQPKITENVPAEQLIYTMDATLDKVGLFSVDSRNGWLQALRAPTTEEQRKHPFVFSVHACIKANSSNCAITQVHIEVIGQELISKEKESEKRNQSHIQEETVEFEQFRYDLDLSERQFLVHGTQLIQLKLRHPFNNNADVYYKFFPSIDEGKQEFSFEQNGIETEDLKLDSKTGELQIVRDVHFTPIGSVYTRHYTVQAINEMDNKTLAITTLIIQSRSKNSQQQQPSQTMLGNFSSIQFIPLPRTVFLAPSKPSGSTILRVSVRAQDSRDGSWHLLPLSAFQNGEGHPLQVHYSVIAPDGLFSMRDNLLILSKPLQPGNLELTIRAELQRRHLLVGDQTKTAHEEIHTITVAEHPLRVVVMSEDGRQRYPVFERISYEFQIDPNAHFPVTFPPLNASLAGGQPIRFRLFPARSGDPTDGLEIHPQTGQLRVHQQFLENFSAHEGGEVFLVVRAVNDGVELEEYFSDASIALIVLPKDLPPLRFDAPLYRFVLREAQQPGTIVDGGASIHLADAAKHSNARIKLQSIDSDDINWTQCFKLLPNGSLALQTAVDMEQMDDASQGVIQMKIVAEEEKQRVAHALVQIQVLDQDEHVPEFVPLFPVFHLHPPISAGQPIGRVSAKDEDFTDRQGTTLAFRAISGNASHLIHVQRDGMLLVKDPSATSSGMYTLLIEVRDQGGLIARTQAKFILTDHNNGMENNNSNMNVENNDNIAEEVEAKGFTVDVPFSKFEVINNDMKPLLSVGDSERWRVEQSKGLQLHFVLEENPDGLFRLDSNTGDLFLRELSTLDHTVQPKSEYQLTVRVEQEQDENSDGQSPRVVLARRIYTVRLVPTTSGEVNQDATTPPITMESATTSSTEAQSTTTTTTTNPAVDDTTTLIAKIDREKTQKTSKWDVTNEGHETLEPNKNAEVVSSTETSVQTAPPEQQQQTLSTPATTHLASKNQIHEGQQQQQQQNVLRFSLSRYHWVVETPAQDALVGRFEIESLADEIVLSIEPPQFRQWFHINSDSETVSLYLREVPDRLYGRQRAEFRVHLIGMQHGRKLAETDASVTVDLNLPPKSTTAISVTTTMRIVNGEETTAIETVTLPSTDDIEIAESSDQQTSIRWPAAVHATTLTAAIDRRFTVSISPMRFNTMATTRLTTPKKEEEADENDGTRNGQEEDIVTQKATTTLIEVDRTPTQQRQKSIQQWTNSAAERFGAQTGTTTQEQRTTTTPKTTSTQSEEDNKDERTDGDEDRSDNGIFRFAATEFKAMLPEGRYGNHGAQLSLRPFSLAHGMPSGVEYSIEEDQQQADDGQALPFYVHKDTGELIAFAEVDREERARYKFHVKAFDPIRQQRAQTLVTVQILDVNDNFPQFLEPLAHVIPLGRLTPAGTRLAQFRAIDPDEGAHGKISYRCENCPSNGWFRLDANTGELLLAKAVPTEEEDNQDVFELILSALDGGRPALRTEHHVRVEVFPEDVALSLPEFRRSEYDAGKVPAGAAQNGTFIWQVTAGTSEHIYYSLIDPPLAHLFVIDSQSGQIRLGRKPLDSERAHQWTLNVSATENEIGIGKLQQKQKYAAFTTVKIFLEPLPSELESSKTGATITKTSSPSTTINGGDSLTNASSSNSVNDAGKQCRFADRVFHTELPENTEGRQRLTTLRVVGCEGRRMHFELHQSTEAFELDKNSGELFAVTPLDRERKSLHFLIANLTSAPFGVASVHPIELVSKEIRLEDDNVAVDGDENNETPEEDRSRTKRREGSGGTKMQFNGLVEQAKSKLANNQALILVRVLDRNDNPPKFQQLTSQGQIVFSVDWQTPLLQPIGRVQAHDPDEHPQLAFAFEGDSAAAGTTGLFAINSSSGVIVLMKSLQAEANDEFKMTVAVADGEHVARAPITIYKLQPGINIALIVIDQQFDQVDTLRAVRHLNLLLNGLEVDILVKQVYIADDGIADPRKTHLLAYALDKQTRVPIPALRLKELLDSAFLLQLNGTSPIPDSPLRHFESVTVPDYGGLNTPFRLTSAEITLLAISVILVFCVCGILFMLLRCCKRRQELITKSDLEYMVDSQIAGPRPYNVELITRKAAQAAQLAIRRLPDPIEECTMSPESRATMIASLGVYASAREDLSKLGGPLRRTRAETYSSTEVSPSSEISNEQHNLLRIKRGRARTDNGINQSETRNQGYENGTTATEISAAIGQQQQFEPAVENISADHHQLQQQQMTGTSGVMRGAPTHEPPPPPPASSPPQLR